jgi:hypothetical protein
MQHEAADSGAETAAQIGSAAGVAAEAPPPPVPPRGPVIGRDAGCEDESLAGWHSPVETPPLRGGRRR